MIKITKIRLKVKDWDEYNDFVKFMDETCKAKYMKSKLSPNVLDLPHMYLMEEEDWTFALMRWGHLVAESRIHKSSGMKNREIH